MDKLALARFCRVDTVKKEVWGIATEETLDSSGEIFDYEASKPHFQEWSSHAEDVTDGGSKGNIRYMHQLDAVGKVIDIQFDDLNKRITIGVKIVDDSVWNKIVERVLTGFSIGGRVMNWVKNKFECKPVEISVVDLPCLPTATYQFVKADGSVETRSFGKEGDMPLPTLRKGMWQIANFANILEDIKYLFDSCMYEGAWEEDDRDISMAEDIKAWLSDGIPLLSRLVAEETSELLESEKAAEAERQEKILELITKRGGSMDWTEIQKRAATLASHFRKSAAFHEKAAACAQSKQEQHSKMEEAHKTMMGCCKADGDDAMKAQMAFHKSSAMCNKALATQNEKTMKAHTAMAEHAGKMAESHEAEEKAAGIEVAKAAAIAGKDQEDIDMNAEDIKKAVVDGMVEGFKAQAAAQAEVLKGVAVELKPGTTLEVVTKEDITKAVEASAKVQSDALADTVTKAVTAAMAGIDIGKLVTEQVEKAMKDIKDAPAPIPATFSLVPRGEVNKAALASTAMDDNDTGL